MSLKKTQKTIEISKTQFAN